LHISDPEIISELYGAGGRFIDKQTNTKTRLYLLTGDSILFDTTTEMYT